MWTQYSIAGNPKKVLYLVIVAGLFTFFVLRLCFFSYRISPEIPPDELQHVGLAHHFSNYWLLPNDTPSSYHLGPVKGSPYLYYLILGKCLRLKPAVVNSILFLRMVNCAMSILTVLLSFVLVSELTRSRIARVFFLTLMTNTPMFTFLSATVNYDNLVNLLSVLAFLFFVRFVNMGGLSRLTICAIFLLLGCITKKSFLPVALIMTVLSVYHLKISRYDLRRALHGFTPKRALLVLALCLSTYMATDLLLGNLMLYGRIIPRPEQVLGMDNALKQRDYARDMLVSWFSEGRLTYDDALKATDMISHRGDRMDAMLILATLQENKVSGKKPLNLLAYSVEWAKVMVLRIYGIAGHRQMLKSGILHLSYVLSILAMLSLSIWSAVQGTQPTSAGYCIVISVFYAMFLLLGVNYPKYSETHAIGIALQGRYLFPVLCLIYAFFSTGVLSLRSQWFKYCLCCAIGILFVAGDLPYFLLNADGAWFVRWL